MLPKCFHIESLGVKQKVDLLRLPHLYELKRKKKPKGGGRRGTETRGAKEGGEGPLQGREGGGEMAGKEEGGRRRG